MDFTTGNFHRLYEEFVSILALNQSKIQAVKSLSEKNNNIWFILGPTVNISMKQFADMYTFYTLDLTGCVVSHLKRQNKQTECTLTLLF